MMLSQDCGRSKFWFLAILFVLLANSADMSQLNTALCRQGIFQPSKGTVKAHYVPNSDHYKTSLRSCEMQ